MICEVILLVGKLLIGVIVVFFLIIKSQKMVWAHGIWFVRRYDAWQMVLRDGCIDHGYAPEMVTNVSGYDADGKKIEVVAIPHGTYITINASENLSVAVVSFDYGLWSNQLDGTWVNAPMNEVMGATIGTHALKYSVNYFSSVKKIQPIAEIPLQIVPLSDPTSLKAGEMLTVQVLYKGKPMSGADVISDFIQQPAMTVKSDDDGKVNVAVNSDMNVIGIEIAFNYKQKTEMATRDKICATLSFTTQEK
jgi:hypothetical protein